MPMTHDELQAAIWNDDRRLSPATREVALAISWVLHAEPEHREKLWRRVTEMLGHDGWRWRIHECVAGDAPRYNPGNWRAGTATCEGPRVRPYRARPGNRASGRCWVSAHHPHLGECQFTIVHGGSGAGLPDRDDAVCGAHATIEVTERDMVTGWETDHWFCSRHKDRAREVKAQLAARGEPPEPVPNTGGLLPRYFAGDWAKIYAIHCEKAHKAWTPPYYGVDADEWPVPGKTMIPKRPRLAVVAESAEPGGSMACRAP